MKRIINMKTKLVAMYLVIAIIPAVLVFFFSQEVYRRDASRMEGVLLDYAATQTANNLLEKTQGYKRLMAQVATDESFMEMLADISRQETSADNKAVIRGRITELFSDYARSDNDLASIVLVTNNLDVVMYQRSVRDWDYISYINDVQLKANLLQYSGQAYMYDVNIMPVPLLEGAAPPHNESVFFTYPAVDPITRFSYGVLVMEVNTDVFNRVINPLEGGLDGNISPFSCLATAQGIVLTCPKTEAAGKPFEELPLPQDTTTRSVEIGTNGLVLNLVVEYGPMQNYIKNFRQIILVFNIATTAFFSVIIIVFINRMTRNSRKIAFAIQQFRETQHVTAVEIDKNDEVLFAIAEQFNQMSAELEALVAELKAKNEHIRKAKDEQHQAEIRALQAQINPHFLYNALDRINWVAIDNGQDEISTMLNGLANLLRYSISNVNVLVPLKSELDWLGQYLLIQSGRFGRAIAMDTKLGDGAGDFPIYKMLLQPLVENSILHGFTRSTQNPCIAVEATVLPEDCLEIRISDNGQGMDTATKTMVDDTIAAHRQGEEGHVGVGNVASRLWHYYGQAGNFSLEQTAPGRTTYRIVIPRKESKDN